MVHLGDPLEDLALVQLRAVARGHAARAARLRRRRSWSAGYAPPPAAPSTPSGWSFYRVLSVVKMIAIMLTGIRAFRDGRTLDLRMAIFDHQLPFLLRAARARARLAGGGA